MDKTTPPKAQKAPEYAQVPIAFLQEILDYMKTKPYQEVFHFIDVLTGRAQQMPQQPQQPQQPQDEPVVTEVSPYNEKV